MKLTILHRYFWPQNYPYATMLKYISEQASESFDEIEIISAIHNEEELNQRQAWADILGFNCKSILMTSERGMPLPKKVISMVKYWCWIIFQLTTIRTDIVMVATTPPVFTAMLVRFFSKLKGFSYIYHCQDIHPESSQYNGNISNGFILELLKKIDRRNVDQARCVICLSEEMKSTLIERGSSGDNIISINNFVFDNPCANLSFVSNEKTKFLFAGTLGHFQNLRILFDVLAKFKTNDKVEFHFMGDGPLKCELESQAVKHEMSNVYFHGMKPLKDAIDAMDKCDFGIVSLHKGLTKVAFPSKAIMYFSRGLPVFACIDDSSDIYDFINKNMLGVAVSNSDCDGMEKAIDSLIQLKFEGYFNKEHIIEIANDNFSKDVILYKFSKVFEEITKK